ncbi:MAG: LysM peptidoglycan-binding domain-containing protein, partial [Verrucomicrobiales bacterium]
MATSVYVIKKGDTLWSIARSHRTSVLTLQRLNGISDAFIRYGDELKVPAAGAALLAKEQKERPVVKEPLPLPLPLPAVKEPAPAVKEPAPAVKEPAPAVKEPAPAVKEPAPAVKEPAPA